MDLTELLHTGKRLVYRSKLLLIGIGIFAILTLLSIFVLPDASNKIGASVNESDINVELGAFPIIKPTIKYGFALDTFQIYEGTIKRGDIVGNILQRYHIDYVSIDKLAQNSKDVFSVSKFREGKKYTILAKDSTQKADYLIYEPSVFEYIVFDLDQLEASKHEREVNYRTRIAGGVMESNLWNAMTNNGLSYSVAAKMEDALQWTVDFYHLQKGDIFKLVFDEAYIDGKPVGVSRVNAAYYKTGEKESYAIYYDYEKDKGYYDEKGRPMKSGFLKSPLRVSRISSHYNLRRYHPILKRVKPHYGTDYAAPYGTPILAVGNGVISKAAYTRGNGNYVKIKHDDVYETQYLHMQKFAKGIRPGVSVKQGDTIGYVGSTGLATGPHVCFRFWKSGKQVNHLKLSFPPAEELPETELDSFNLVKDAYLKQLETAKIDYSKLKEEEINS
ncbi:MAG: peptidoglycan DD-metalloendopeptidase family protein [Bacteroidota bacterium]